MSPTDEAEIIAAASHLDARDLPYSAQVMRMALARAKSAESDLSTAREEIAALRWYFARYGGLPIGDALPIVSKTQAKEAAVLEALRSSRTKGETP